MFLNKKGILAIGVMFAILVILILCFLILKPSNKNVVNGIPSALFQEPNINPKENTITPIPPNPDIKTYTSKKLGIQFQYSENQGLWPIKQRIKIKEEGNRISLIYIDNNFSDEWIEVYPYYKTPNNSLMDQVYNDFVFKTELKNENCSVLRISPDDSDITEVKIIDKNLISEPHSPSVITVCKPEYYLPFRSYKSFPDRYIYIQYPSEVVSSWADTAKRIPWTDTIKLIDFS